jgi:2,3-bisphosphoglycerate-independent phosphoglycerate mutase
LEESAPIKNITQIMAIGLQYMNRTKTLIFLGDGMADEPIPELGGKTPIEVAHTPGMDAIAAAGCSGSLLTLPPGYPTSSDVANMSVLGCNLDTEYAGRGVLEAASQNIALKPNDIVFRMNLITVENGILKDFSGGHPSQQDAETLIDALNEHLATQHVRFYKGVSYRNLLVISGDVYNNDISTEKPDDNQGEPVREHLPQAQNAGAQATVQMLHKLMQDAAAILENHPINLAAKASGHAPANQIWINSGGSPKPFRTIQQRYGMTGAIISAVDVIKGLGRCLGMDVINVPGATGYIDTNYEGKAAAAVEALQTHDFVYLHLEAIDEVSHAQDLKLKIETIEAFDRRIVVPVLEKLGINGVTYALLPDHPVPVRLGKHTREPVPVSIAGPGWKPDSVTQYSETACPQGSLGTMPVGGLMQKLFGQ